jgi:hypothetical protein
MAIEEVDLQEEVEGRIVEQFKNKDNILAIVTYLTTQVTQLQTMFLQLAVLYQVASAEGEQLDGIGQIVGEERFGRSDEQYRPALLARIRLNLSRGTAEDIIELVRAVAGESAIVKIREYFPASFIAEVIDAVDPDTIDLTTAGILVASGKPAGVGGGVHFHVDPVFRYDTANQGFDLGKYAKIF